MDHNWRWEVLGAAIRIRTNPFIAKYVLMFKGYSVTLVGLYYGSPISMNDNEAKE